MTLTFPRAMPDGLRPVGMSFVLQPVVELSPLRSGRTISLDLGPSLWAASWQSPPLDEEQAGIVSSWYDTLLSSKTFLAYHKLRQYPLAYSKTGWPNWSPAFDGTVLLASVNVNLVELNLSGCPAGLILSVGDFLGFRNVSGAYELHRVAVGATANGAGLMTVEVRPPVRPGYPVGSPGARHVSLYRPPAEMFIQPGSWSETITGSGDFTSVSFSAIQTLY